VEIASECMCTHQQFKPVSVCKAYYIVKPG